MRVLFFITCLCLLSSDSLTAQDAKPTSGQSETIDFEKARGLLQREGRGEKLSKEEAAYLERAKAARRAGQGQASNPRMISGKANTGLKPLTEMLAEDRYEGQDGGLYGGGKNTPPDEHRKAAEDAIHYRIRPRGKDGEFVHDGRIGFVSISMSNATQEFSFFKKIADADEAKSSQVTIVDCAQGGQAMAEWVDPKGNPWKEADRRIATAGLSPEQVQVAWIKLANKGPRGDLQEHGKKLEKDTLAVIHNAFAKFPNLQIAYLSSRIYGGYATGALNPEPYAYEGAFPTRWLIQRQIEGDKELTHIIQKAGEKVKSPLLLWGPYLWADGVTPRKSDGLSYARSDLAADGTHPSEAGRKKVADLMLDFFKKDELAKGWFVRTKAMAEEESRIIEIARKAVAENDDWVERAVFPTPIREADGSWSLRVQRIPFTSGGERYLSIDAKGNVTKYGRGL
jgi:hypothetical protein